ncbi:hypothetical protein [Streptomyces sp. BE133]|uniref:hypothetical protein n=1 Tax=Streptomyces sp. BE133 TaxID=3002523 RepID=UPI002E79BFA3|nr:hypothetical protein [Streptomyces sp. BE133]MEE1807577.1 hypothetical protein [Streptomyces sp. BE133]
MDESRQSSSGAGAVLHRFAPPPAFCGFLLLLALMFTVSYAVGAVAGPVAPGMHGTGTSTGGGRGDGGGGGGADTDDMDMGGTGGMHGGGH